MHKSAAACSLAALILAACGGNDSGSNSAQPDQQSKGLTRQSKSAVTTYQTAVESLYVAYFGRPADPNGLANFSAALQAANAPTDVAGLAVAYSSNATVKGLIDSFGTSNESQKLYGSGTTTDFVTAVFQNVLGRAPLSAGLSFWVSAIDSGRVSQGDAALSIMAGALANTSAQGLIDAQLVNNRLTAAGYFTGAASPSTYTGAAAAADARALLTTINSTTSASTLQSAAVTDAQAFNNKMIFESNALNGGEWSPSANIPYGGGVLTSGTNYAIATVSYALNASPSNGPQQASSHYVTLDPALALPGYSVTRVLQNGQIFVRPAIGLRSVAYVGNGINVQYYDSTGQAVVTTTHLDNFQSGTLSGPISNSPETLEASVPTNLWAGYGNFSLSANWQAGSSYVTHSSHGVGDLYVLFDCANVAAPTYTYGTAPTPCKSNTTLASIFPISQYSGDINKPYEIDNASDGSFTTVQGLPMWIANNPMSLEQGGQTQVYRIYVQLNGNVYYGSLAKDGTAVYVHQIDGSYVDYSLALNQAGANSIGQGLITGSGQGSQSGGGAAVADTIDMFGIGGTGVSGALSPADLRAHYNVPATLTGAGQTIAIVDAPSSANIEDDLTSYSKYYNLPLCTSANGCFTHYVFPPSNNTTNWGPEPDIDVQMAHAIAPGAKILLVTAASASANDLFSAVHYALSQPGVTAVSMSFFGPDKGSMSDSDFYNAANAGGPIAFACSGDGGFMSTPLYPAADTWVIAVGGTRVKSVQWVNNQSDLGWQFSGGGTAASWQSTTWMNAMQPQNILAGQRGVPDVAAVADFQNSAVSVIYENQWGLDGGTSVAAPIWAGVAALFGESVGAKNQSLLSKLGSPTGGFSQILYQMAASSNSANLFYRANGGTNNALGANCPLCTATGNYNEVTGLGSPNVANMVAYLGGKAPATAAVSTLDIDRLGKPAYKMTRRMLQELRKMPLPATQTMAQQVVTPY